MVRGKTHQEYATSLSHPYTTFEINSRAREEHFKPAKDFYRLSKENEGLFDGLGIAVPLIGALFFTIIFVALLVMQLVK